MIKATGSRKNGKPFVLLGITDDNVRELTKGNPLKLNLRDVELDDIEIAVIYGKSEKDLVAQLGPLLGPDTTLRDET